VGQWGERHAITTLDTYAGIAMEGLAFQLP
jgi:hypothetical protein